MRRSEHYRQAEVLLGQLEQLQAQMLPKMDDLSKADMEMIDRAQAMLVAEAQVHATLATVSNEVAGPLERINE